MYNWESDPSVHAQRYAGILNSALDSYWEPALQQILKLQSIYYNYFYSWDMRASQWTTLLTGLKAEFDARPKRQNYPY
jgi:hypothetical protein